MDDSDTVEINAVHTEQFVNDEIPNSLAHSCLPKTRLLEVAESLSGFISPYVGKTVVSMAPKVQLSDIDGVTLAVVCPTGSEKGKLRNGLVESAYTYEIGIMRLLRDDELIEECVAVTESIGEALLSTGILPCEVEISNVENSFLDTELVRRRRQFTSVLTVSVDDCLLAGGD